MEIIKKELTVEQQVMNYGVKSFIKGCTAIPEGTDIIYQYTNVDALFNGIIVKEPQNKGEEICLWASNYLYMNDPTEIATGKKYINEILKEYFIDNHGERKAAKDEDDSLDYYITSFSMTRDSLPMWGMYGKNGAGIALGFDRTVIEKTNQTLYKCTYLDEEIKDKVRESCEKIKGEKISEDALGIVLIIALITLFLNKDEKQNAEIIDSFMPFILFTIYTKDPAYRYEDEVRLLIHSDKDSKIKCRAQSNLIIPYIENSFPKEALKAIIVGPTNDMRRTVKSIKRYLDYMGFKDVDIIPSVVPYRG